MQAKIVVYQLHIWIHSKCLYMRIFSEVNGLFSWNIGILVRESRNGARAPDMRHPETRDLQTLAASHAGAEPLASSTPARLPPGRSRRRVAALTRRELVHEPSRARFGLKAVAPGAQAVPALVRGGALGSLARAVIGVLTLAARPSSCSDGAGASAAAAPRRLHGSGSTRRPPRRQSWSDKAMLLNALVPEDAANVIISVRPRTPNRLKVNWVCPD